MTLSVHKNPNTLHEALIFFPYKFLFSKSIRIFTSFEKGIYYSDFSHVWEICRDFSVYWISKTIWLEKMHGQTSKKYAKSGFFHHACPTLSHNIDMGWWMSTLGRYDWYATLRILWFSAFSSRTFPLLGKSQNYWIIRGGNSSPSLWFLKYSRP